MSQQQQVLSQQQQLDSLRREYRKLEAAHSNLHSRYRSMVDKFRCETAARICAVLAEDSIRPELSVQRAVIWTDLLISELEKNRVDLDGKEE